MDDRLRELTDDIGRGKDETATEHVRWHDGSWHAFQVGRRGAQYDLGAAVHAAMIEENHGSRRARVTNLRIRAYKGDTLR